MKLWVALLIVLTAGLMRPASADAGLTVFKTFTGPVGLSTDGFGSTTQSGTVSAEVPAGATVLGAYLYTSTFENPTLTGVGGTLAGTPVTYSSLGVNVQSCCSLTAARSDVTDIIKPLIDGGPGGVYNFTVTETDGSQDGEALVVVYSLAGNPDATVGLLDGFAAVEGDSTSINFAEPLAPLDPGFFAEMRLGIGFSCCTSQRSTIEVNGTVITENAGNHDDGDATANGALFTMGGFDDPFSALNPGYNEDHERYNLVPQISPGDTSIFIETFNTSEDDNIFLAAFYVSGIAGIDEEPPNGEVPEPATMTLLATGIAGLAARRYREKKRQRQ